MSAEQGLDLYDVMQRDGVTFAEACEEEHYLTRRELDALHRIALERTPWIGQILLRMGVLSAAQLRAELLVYQAEASASAV